jgi:hypothetical protein
MNGAPGSTRGGVQFPRLAGGLLLRAEPGGRRTVARSDAAVACGHRIPSALRGLAGIAGLVEAPVQTTAHFRWGAGCFEDVCIKSFPK